MAVTPEGKQRGQSDMAVCVGRQGSKWFRRQDQRGNKEPVTGDRTSCRSYLAMNINVILL